MPATLILSPEFTFERLQRDLVAHSWFRQAEMPVTAPPLLPGEPELASWQHQQADGRIVYTFNPVVSLRVLSFYGGAAAELMREVAERLPVLHPGDLLTLLKSEDLPQLLLGIFAVGETKEIGALGEIHRLGSHPEPMIARAAAATQEKLLRVSAEKCLNALAREKARHPERSVLFPLLGDAPQRQQIICWLMHYYTEANEHILAVLHSALQDQDWTVRATAMLAAARFNATSLIALVRKIELPQTSRAGLDADDRRLLRALRKASVLLLEGHAVPDESTEPQDEREAARSHMLRCVAGLPVSNFDRVFLLVQTLTRPVMVDEEATAPGVDEEQVH